MATCKRTRVSAVAAGDLEESMENYLTKCSTRDLHLLVVKPMSHCTWKTAPSNDMPAILQNATLYKELLCKAPNGVLSPAATKTAVQNLQKAGPVNTTSKPLGVFADSVSEKIRIGLAKLRECQKRDVLQVVERKLSHPQTKKLAELLNLLEAAPARPPATPQAKNAAQAHIEYDEDEFPIFRADAVEENNSGTSTPAVHSVSSFNFTAFSYSTLGDGQHKNLLQLALGTPSVAPKEKRSCKKEKQTKRTKTSKKGAAGNKKDKQLGKHKSTSKSKGKQLSKGQQRTVLRATSAQDEVKAKHKRVHSKAYHSTLTQKLQETWLYHVPICWS